MSVSSYYSGTRLLSQQPCVTPVRAPALRVPRSAQPPVFRWLAGMWIGLVAYGSLVPFAFQPLAAVHNPSDIWRGIVYWLTLPKWYTYQELAQLAAPAAPNLDSALWLNLVLYLPIGFLLRLDARQRRPSWWRQMLTPTLTVALTSWLLEATQGLTVNRIADINDFVENLAGGILGALIAVQTLKLLKKTIFWCYCRLAYPLHQLGRIVEEQTGRSNLMPALTAILVLVAGAWFLLGLRQAPPADGQPINWMPFAQQFEFAYDVGMTRIARSLIVWLFIAILASLQLRASGQRRGLRGLTLTICGMAGLMEIFRLFLADRRADITEPIIAGLAVMGLAALAYVLSKAVRASCRRKMPKTHPGPERRRTRHLYQIP